MSKTFRPYEPEQMLLMPASLRDWLPEDHLAYFISDVVDHLDLGAIMARYEAEERGYPPYHPQMMVKVLLYAYCIGVPSSRKIAKRLEEDVAFRVLSANNTPDFRTISGFRKEHLSVLAELFVQVLQLCQSAGLVKLGHVALDGTKLKANASKHKAMSYGRMKQGEARFEEEVKRLLKEAEVVDEEEDRRYGKDKRGDELPRELARRESRLKKIREAKAALEAEALEQAKAVEDKRQRNFTDPDSHIMLSSDKSFIQAYNCQAAVDSQSQVVVACEATNQASDKLHLKLMVAQVEANAGDKPKKLSADAGYFSEENLKLMEREGVEAYIPPDKQRHTETLPAAPRGRIPNGLSLKERMRRKLRTKKGQSIYSKRKVSVEPVFGQIKQARGFRQFLLRGLRKVSAEWRLICLTHNLLKLYATRRWAIAQG
jgi:transposase